MLQIMQQQQQPPKYTTTNVGDLLSFLKGNGIPIVGGADPLKGLFYSDPGNISRLTNENGKSIQMAELVKRIEEPLSALEMLAIVVKLWASVCILAGALLPPTLAPPDVVLKGKATLVILTDPGQWFDAVLCHLNGSYVFYEMGAKTSAGLPGIRHSGDQKATMSDGSIRNLHYITIAEDWVGECFLVLNMFGTVGKWTIDAKFINFAVTVCGTNGSYLMKTDPPTNPLARMTAFLRISRAEAGAPLRVERIVQESETNVPSSVYTGEMKALVANCRGT
jgi:hypothetical protein